MMRASALVLVAALYACLPEISAASEDLHVSESDSAEVRQAVMRFVAAIDRLDLDGVVDSFAEDAEAFYPFSFTGERLNGRDEIRAAQKRAFDWARRQLVQAGTDEAPSLNLNPTDMRIRMLRNGAAVATWHSNRPGHYGRRSATLERIDGRWLIVTHHASNIAKPQ